MSKKMDWIIREGIASGMLGAHDAQAQSDQRPWPVLVLTAVAAWFSAIPLVLVLALLFENVLRTGGPAIMLGSIVLSGAVAALRTRTLPLFAEQLALPGLLAGLLLMGTGVHSMAGSSVAAVLLAAVCSLVAWAVPRHWLRSLLGIAIASLLAFAVMEARPVGSLSALPQWLAWQAAAAVWLATFVIQRRIKVSAETAHAAAALEALGGGLAVAALAGLAFGSGQTFLLGASLGLQEFSNSSSLPGPIVYMQLVSIVAASVAGLGLARKWAALRTWWFGVLVVVITSLAWFLPSLGAALLVMAACVGSGRMGLAALAGVSALWMIGGLYYQLAWPLADKAILLVAIGAALGALVRWAVPGEARAPLDHGQAATTRAARRQVIGKSGLAMLLCAALVLAVANTAIWQKEKLIAQGQRVFVELAPVDPRSLMQGYYMTLNFVPLRALGGEAPASTRALAVARIDGRGIAELLRWDKGKALAPGEFKIELILKAQGWILVTDAWYFKEGEAERWSKARYGRIPGHARRPGAAGGYARRAVRTALSTWSEINANPGVQNRMQCKAASAQRGHCTQEPTQQGVPKPGSNP